MYFQNIWEEINTVLLSSPLIYLKIAWIKKKKKKDKARQELQVASCRQLWCSGKGITSVVKQTCFGSLAALLTSWVTLGK